MRKKFYIYEDQFGYVACETGGRKFYIGQPVGAVFVHVPELFWGTKEEFLRYLKDTAIEKFSKRKRK